MTPIFLSYVNDMETKEQKEQETLDISKLTRFQKRQIISLFEKYSSENREVTKSSFHVCPKMWKGTSMANQSRENPPITHGTTCLHGGSS